MSFSPWYHTHPCDHTDGGEHAAAVSGHGSLHAAREAPAPSGAGVSP